MRRFSISLSVKLTIFGMYFLEAAGISLPTEFVPATQAELARFMAENSLGPRRTICPAGGRTSLFWGTDHAADMLVSLCDLTRIVDYPARDMTITVEAGIRVAELQSVLATEGQRLPIDIAQSGRATLGGALVTNSSGPRRFGHGTFRDYVIGVSAVDAAGQLFKAGGRVVKNVAGYDICKLLVGSRGTLGIVSQVTLKLRPIAETSALLWCSFSTLDQIELAIQKLLLSATRPIAMEVLNVAAAKSIGIAARHSSNFDLPVLCLGFEGTSREVDWQIETARQELQECAAQVIERIDEPVTNRFWDAFTEFQTCADDPLTFQANLLPSKCIEFANRCTDLGIATQIHAGNGIVIGQLPDDAATISKTKNVVIELRNLAVSASGNLLVLHCDSEWKNQISPYGISEPDWKHMRRLKRTLDPLNLLNPGRFVDGSPDS